MGSILKGVQWSAVERFSTQFIQFFISVVLARLLSPNDFGVVAIATVFLSILQTINEIGFGAALIKKLDRDEVDYCSVFFLNIILGLVLYALFCLCAPGIAHFFKMPQLEELLYVVGLNLIVTSLFVVQRTILLIKVDFKTQAKASLTSVILSGVIGIYLAYKGYGPKALVYQALLANVINVAFIWFVSSWRPKLLFSYARLKTLFNFAYKLILARLINSVFSQMNSFIIGKGYSPAELGYYNRAASFESMTSTNIVQIVQRVSSPVLCSRSCQEDNKEMGRALLRFITGTALIVYPLLVGLFVLAEPLVVTILTSKWMASVSLLQLIVPCGFFMVVSNHNCNIFNATGRTDYALYNEIIKNVISLVVMLIALHYSIYVFVASMILVSFIRFVLDTWYTRKQIGLTIMVQVKSVFPIFLLSMVMGGIVWLSISFIENNVLKLIVGTCIGIVSYLGMCLLTNVADSRKILLHIIKK